MFMGSIIYLYRSILFICYSQPSFSAIQSVLSRARGGRTTFSRSPFFWTLVIRRTSEKSKATTSSCMIPCVKKHGKSFKKSSDNDASGEISIYSNSVHWLCSPCCLFSPESSSSPPAAAYVQHWDRLL